MDWTPEVPPTAKDIAGHFRQAIADGTYAAGSQLPSAKSVATRLGVALMTVQSAYKQLADDALVEGRRGSGTYVTDPQKGERTAAQTALGLRELQDHLSHVTSQLSDLRGRVERLEAAQPDPADETQ